MTFLLFVIYMVCAAAKSGKGGQSPGQRGARHLRHLCIQKTNKILQLRVEMIHHATEHLQSPHLHLL